MSEELKPCPFCGGKASVKSYVLSDRDDAIDVARVECTECGVYVTVSGEHGGVWIDEYGRYRGEPLKTERLIPDAVAKWNRRAVDADRLREIAEELKHVARSGEGVTSLSMSLVRADDLLSIVNEIIEISGGSAKSDVGDDAS